MSPEGILDAYERGLIAFGPWVKPLAALITTLWVIYTVMGILGSM